MNKTGYTVLAVQTTCIFSLDIPNVDKPININVRNSTYYTISKNNKQFSLDYSLYEILPVLADSDCTEHLYFP